MRLHLDQGAPLEYSGRRIDPRLFRATRERCGPRGDGHDAGLDLGACLREHRQVIRPQANGRRDDRGQQRRHVLHQDRRPELLDGHDFGGLDRGWAEQLLQGGGPESDHRLEIATAHTGKEHHRFQSQMQRVRERDALALGQLRVGDRQGHGLFCHHELLNERLQGAQLAERSPAR